MNICKELVVVILSLFSVQPTFRQLHTVIGVFSNMAQDNKTLGNHVHVDVLCKLPLCQLWELAVTTI